MSAIDHGELLSLLKASTLAAMIADISDELPTRARHAFRIRALAVLVSIVGEKQAEEMIQDAR